MKIVACVKRVPVTTLQPRIASGGRHVDPAGVEHMSSFYDDIAVEEALRLAEAHGGEVVVLSLGPPEVSKELREALAKGAGAAVILVDPAWGERDARATAAALAEEIRRQGADLVLAGRVATDRDNAAVGPMIASLLDWACVTDAVEVALDGRRLTVKREADGGVETYACELPAVVTCQKDLNEPRYAGLKGIMAAKKKPLEERPAPAAEAQAEVVELALPPPRKPGRIVGTGAEGIAALIAALCDEAKVL